MNWFLFFYSGMVYFVDKIFESTEIFFVEIEDEPWQMGDFRLVLFYGERTGEADASLGRQYIGKRFIELLYFLPIES